MLTEQRLTVDFRKQKSEDLQQTAKKKKTVIRTTSTKEQHSHTLRTQQLIYVNLFICDLFLYDSAYY